MEDSHPERRRGHPAHLGHSLNFAQSDRACVDESPMPLLFETAESHSGELQRRVSRISGSSLLASWKREWCVLSHNFLVLFASRTNLVVNKCILLSAIERVEPLDLCSFRIALTSSEDVALRVPRGLAQDREAKHWVYEIQRRETLVRTAGQRIVSCIPLSEANRLVDHLKCHLDDVVEYEAFKAQKQMREDRCRTLLRVISAVIKAKTRASTRQAFDNLLVHGQRSLLQDAEYKGALQQLQTAVGRPRLRLLSDTLSHWVRANAQETRFFASEWRRSCRKRVHLGVLVLAAVVRDRQRGLFLAALSNIYRHAEEREGEWLRGSKGETLRFHNLVITGTSTETPHRVIVQCAPCRAKDPLGVVTHRLRTAASLLRAVLCEARHERCEWALHTLSLASAQGARWEAEQMLCSASQLHQQLLKGCGVRAVVQSIRAAQLRRARIAFTDLSARSGAALRTQSDSLSESEP
uniref:PH domain-containing protein n=1 Tax=Noctiluca scintillans TaxID=2966 RepID=A0A7S0ZVF0_NOCSC|mmetsp:Transcript_20369/g.54467  ORF Transcript_20369/g.54467 Transcript_20369/m.54467 type:complete len:467 (+) Transcript_20369:86-1486(+)